VYQIGERGERPGGLPHDQYLRLVMMRSQRVADQTCPGIE
jgi:hypothetical protein